MCYNHTQGNIYRRSSSNIVNNIDENLNLMNPNQNSYILIYSHEVNKTYQPMETKDNAA